MITIQKVIIRKCDICGSEDFTVNTYDFVCLDDENEETTEHIEFCSNCQKKVYHVLKRFVDENRK